MSCPIGTLIGAPVVTGRLSSIKNSGFYRFPLKIYTSASFIMGTNISMKALSSKVSGIIGFFISQKQDSYGFLPLDDLSDITPLFSYLIIDLF